MCSTSCDLLTASAVSPGRKRKPLKRLCLTAARGASLKRGINKNGYSDAAGAFCAGCLPGADRVAVTCRAAFLRRKYAIRRLRLTRTRSFWPMEPLSNENRINAIGIEPVSPFFVDPLSKSACLGLVRAVEIVIAFSRDLLLKGTLTWRKEHRPFPQSPPEG